MKQPRDNGKFASLPLEDRFWEKVDKTDSCWVWTGAISNGYGSFTVDGKPARAHRVSLSLAGRSLEGGEVDHLCRNRACVRPEHLEVVSHSTNVTRGTSRKELCSKGIHEMTTDNVYEYVNKEFGGSQRQCRQCKSIYGKRRYLSLKEERSKL